MLKLVNLLSKKGYSALFFLIYHYLKQNEDKIIHQIDQRIVKLPNHTKNDIASNFFSVTDPLSPIYFELQRLQVHMKRCKFMNLQPL